MRDRHRCAYCGRRATTVDHVVPRSRGGQDTWLNTVAACAADNHRKADRTPEQAGMRLLVRPFEPTPADALLLALGVRDGAEGGFPSWLAPTQAVVMNITDAQADAVAALGKALANQGFRVTTDLRNEKIGYKIREHTLQRIPYLLVIGDREKENGTVAVRTRSGEDLGSMSPEDFVARLCAEQGPLA